MKKIGVIAIIVKEGRKSIAKVNEIYAEFFTEPYPARSCVEVARLPKDLLVEMEAIVELK